jgi:hypothetical protein
MKGDLEGFSLSVLYICSFAVTEPLILKGSCSDIEERSCAKE